MGKAPEGEWAARPGLLGERLLEARAAAEMSQEGLAARSGVNRITITKIETGKIDPQLSTVYRLASGLGVSVESLLPGTPTRDA